MTPPRLITAPGTRPAVIGYYVHHRGRGHLHRTLSIARHLPAPPTLLSSLPAPAADVAVGWVPLPPDDRSRPADHTAHGTLHWVPRHDRGLRRRMTVIADWIDRADPDLMVVDVSVEVAALCRLLGVPTVVTAMPGDRTDRAHRFGYDSAHAILAPWAREFGASQWSDRWPDKTFHAGAISRFGGRPAPPVRRPGGPRRVLMLWGGDGGPPDAVVAAAVRATPGCRWRVAGHGPDAAADVWDLLGWADVVVTHAGQNAVAEVAAARRPAVVVAQPRPHGEQLATARTLDRAGLAVALESFPEPDRWPELLAAAGRIGGAGWVRWAPPDAARRAAEFLLRTAGEVRGTVTEPATEPVA